MIASRPSYAQAMAAGREKSGYANRYDFGATEFAQFAEKSSFWA